MPGNRCHTGGRSFPPHKPEGAEVVPFGMSNDGSHRFPLDRWIAGRHKDEWLAGQVAEALRKDPLVRGKYLEIIVQNRVVVLRGVMSSAEACEAASRRIWTLSGVADVSNQLSVDDDRPM
jgi:hypothetical protein